LICISHKLLDRRVGIENNNGVRKGLIRAVGKGEAVVSSRWVLGASQERFRTVENLGWRGAVDGLRSTLEPLLCKGWC